MNLEFLTSMLGMNIWGWWAVITIAFFLLIELGGYFTGWYPTLSQTVWHLSKNYPIFAPIVAFLLGLGLGILFVHFWGTGMCPGLAQLHHFLGLR